MSRGRKGSNKSEIWSWILESESKKIKHWSRLRQSDSKNWESRSRSRSRTKSPCPHPLSVGACPMKLLRVTHFSWNTVLTLVDMLLFWAVHYSLVHFSKIFVSFQLSPRRSSNLQSNPASTDMPTSESPTSPPTSSQYSRQTDPNLTLARKLHTLLFHVINPRISVLTFKEHSAWAWYSKACTAVCTGTILSVKYTSPTGNIKVHSGTHTSRIKCWPFVTEDAVA